MNFSSNIDAVIAALRKVPKNVERRFSKIIQRTVIQIDESIHERTPVWSGRAIRNMIWQKGSPNSIEFEPIGAGEEGEGRRGANSAAARSSREALDFKNPFDIYYLSNNARHIVELEAGLLPYPGKHPAGGMFGMTYAEVITKLGK